MAGEFADTSAESRFVTSSDKWLNHPVAVLKATNDADGRMVSALVKLSAPHYNASEHTLHFKVPCVK